MNAEKQSAKKAAGDSATVIHQLVADVKKKKKATFRRPGFVARRETVHSPRYHKRRALHSASFLKLAKQGEGKDINQQPVIVGLRMA